MKNKANWRYQIDSKNISNQRNDIVAWNGARDNKAGNQNNQTKANASNNSVVSEALSIFNNRHHISCQLQHN